MHNESRAGWRRGGCVTIRRMNTRTRRGVAAIALAFVALALTACTQHLIPTPYAAYGEEGRLAFASTAPELRTSDIPVLYVTDRVADKAGPRGPEYGYKRSRDMVFGTATVSLGKDISWEQLVEDSVGPKRSRTYTPRVEKVQEAGKLESVVTRIIVEDGGLTFAPDAADRFAREQKPFNDLLSMWLARTERKEVVVFVHGYNNTFDDAILRLSQAWHFSGRRGVPLVYTWPAGSGGLKGYAYDRESGEFTNTHFKRLLIMLALHPEVEKVHVISHSRGTDVASTAIRELHYEVRGAVRSTPLGARAAALSGETLDQLDGTFHPADTATVLKLQTLVLAAPDLDLEVFVQRFFGDNVLQAARRVVIYFSKEDEALGISDWLFRSKRRLGAMRLEDFPPTSRPMFAQLRALELINTRVHGYTTHSYILQHPAALSDIMRLLGDAAPAGTERRPLKVAEEGIWELNDDYLDPKGK